MIAVFISWVIMSFVFVTAGDMLVNAYSRSTKHHESYGFVGMMMLGMTLVTIVISILSLWVPINHYLMFAFIGIGIVYWLANRNRLSIYCAKIQSLLHTLKGIPLFFAIILLLGVAILMLWQFPVFDSLYYHQQNIRWNEEFSVVPGLGNLEDRFAFNSNYMLLSALFSLRFLFGEGIFLLQSLLMVTILVWILLEVLRSQFDIRRIALLLVYCAFIYTFIYTFTTTSTDAMPNLISLYLIALFLMHPKKLHSNYLLATLLPVLLITFKISIVPLLLIALYALFQASKSKNYKALAFLLVACILIVVPWLIRNVVISGYLVFPMHEIDFFSFDWKMPAWVAQEERRFIHDCAQDMWMAIKNLFAGKSITSLFNIIVGVTLFYGIFVVSAPFAVVYGYFCKKMDASVWLLYLTLFLVTCIWYFQGPDPRFIAGVLTATVFFSMYIFLPNKKIKHQKVRFVIMFVFSIFPMGWGISRTFDAVKKQNLTHERAGIRSKWSVLVQPYSLKEQLRSHDIAVDDFDPYPLNESITIYISNSRVQYGGRMITHDVLPSTVDPRDEIYKYQPIETIEARGKTLQDGFRPKTMEPPVGK